MYKKWSWFRVIQNLHTICYCQLFYYSALWELREKIKVKVPKEFSLPVPAAGEYLDSALK
jgi:hypothetical protein